MSHIQKTAKGTYKVRWTDPATGKERSRTFRKQQTAKAFRTSIDHSVLNSSYVDPRRGLTPLREYVDSWLVNRKMASARYRIADNAIRLHINPRIGDLRLGSIEASHVQEWVDALAKDLSPGSVRNVYEILSRILSCAVEERFIHRSPLTRKGDGAPVVLPERSTVNDRWLTELEVSMLIVNAPEDLRVLVQFLASTGLRIGEALGLVVECIDTRRQLVKVTRQRRQDGTFGATKTKASRSVPVPARSIAALRPLVEGKSAKADLWVSDLGETLDYRAFRYRWKKAVLGANLGWSPSAHDLRHFYASKLIYEGVDIVRVSAYLGHANTTMTLNVYSHLMGQDHSDVDAVFGDLPLG